MSKTKKESKAQQAAQAEVHSLLKEAGKSDMDKTSLVNMLEEVCQAVGLRPSHTDRLVHRVSKLINSPNVPQIKVGFKVWVKGEEVEVIKITDKMITFKYEGREQRISKKNLGFYPAIISDKASLVRALEASSKGE